MGVCCRPSTLYSCHTSQPRFSPSRSSNLTVHDVDGDKDFPVQNLASGPLTVCKAIYHKFDRSPKCSHIIRSCPSFNLCLLYAEHCQAPLIELNLPDPVSIPVIEDDPLGVRPWPLKIALFGLKQPTVNPGKSSPWALSNSLLLSLPRVVPSHTIGYGK